MTPINYPFYGWRQFDEWAVKIHERYGQFRPFASMYSSEEYIDRVYGPTHLDSRNSEAITRLRMFIRVHRYCRFKRKNAILRRLRDEHHQGI